MAAAIKLDYKQIVVKLRDDGGRLHCTGPYVCINHATLTSPLHPHRRYYVNINGRVRYGRTLKDSVALDPTLVVDYLQGRAELNVRTGIA